MKQIIDSIIAVTETLIKMKTVSSSSNKEVIDYVEKELLQNSFEVEVQTYKAKNGLDKYNLVAKLGKGNGGLALIAHADVVPGQEDKWAAFEPEIKDGKLFGRGSCDMKGAISVFLHVIKDLDQNLLQQPLWVIITADEETSSIGAKYMLKHSKMLSKQKPKYGLIAEPTLMQPIYAHKGWATFEITAQGTAMHTSIDKGESSNFKIAPFLSEMTELKQKFLTDSSYMNKEFEPPTNGFNMTINDYNAPLNVTSDKTICGLSYRVMHNANSDKILSTIKEKANKYKLDISYDYTNGLHTNPDRVFVKECVTITNAEKALTVPYNTDGSTINQIIKELVILGPGNIEQAHTIGEFIEIDELSKAYQVYNELIKTFCE